MTQVRIAAFALLLCYCHGQALRATVWRPSWADPQVYEGIQFKRTFVSQMQQTVQILDRKYYWSDAKQRCNARVVEEVEFDFSPQSLDFLRPEYESQLNPRDRVPFIGGAVREYYMYPGSVLMDLERVEVISGAQGITYKVAEVVPSGPHGNSTFQVRFNFTPSTRDRVSFRITLFVWNFVESRLEYNLIYWRPYGPGWEGEQGAFVANATFEIRLPYGRSALGDHPIPHRVPAGKGYNIYTNLRNPLPTEAWTDNECVIRVNYDLWISEWDSAANSQGNYPGAGQEPLRIDILFDKQVDRCDSYPYWIYLVCFGAVLTFLFFGSSLVGYCYFERPWEYFSEADPFSGRKRLLDQMRREKEDERRRDSAIAQSTAA